MWSMVSLPKSLIIDVENWKELILFGGVHWFAALKTWAFPKSYRTQVGDILGQLLQRVSRKINEIRPEWRLGTLPKFNMEPRNHGFQVRNLLFQGAIFRWTLLNFGRVWAIGYRSLSFSSRWSVIASDEDLIENDIMLRISIPERGLIAVKIAFGFNKYEMYNQNIKILLGGGFKFQAFFIFTPIWGRFPLWLIFFRWVETTNQIKMSKYFKSFYI